MIYWRCWRTVFQIQWPESRRQRPAVDKPGRHFEESSKAIIPLLKRFGPLDCATAETLAEETLAKAARYVVRSFSKHFLQALKGRNLLEVV